MSFLSRMFIPRGVRRAAHPLRTVRRAVTPKPIKRARRLLHPVDNAVYGLERSLNTKQRVRGSSTVYRHGNCSVRHRSVGAAERCRNR